MRGTLRALMAAAMMGAAGLRAAEPVTIPRFPLPESGIALHRLAQPRTPFNKIGRKFALLGFESGRLEAWAWPLKLISGFEFSFLFQGSSRPVAGGDLVRYIDVNPAATTLTFTCQSFVIKAHYIAAFDQAAGMILLEVESDEPLKVICSFHPVLQPMWPAAIGGQYAYWNEEMKAYLISEPRRQNHAFVGSPAAAGISYTPAHMLSDAPNEFIIDIPEPEQLSGRFLPIYFAGGKGSRDSVKALYDRISAAPEALYRDCEAHYRRVLQSGVRIATPVAELDLAYDWAKIALDRLMVENPDLGRGLAAGWGASGSSGRPGFGWFFGGDAYINALGLTAMSDHAAVRDALLFTQKWQRADGKMAHELSQGAGYIDWFGAYPYGYIHGDTTPFYLAASCEYVRASGDLEYLRASWSSLKRAYAWSLSVDQNGDGLMDNARAGLGSVEYGALTNLATDIYTGSLAVHMSAAMHKMAELLGDRKTAAAAAQHHARARLSFDEKFWDESAATYSNAFNDQGERLPDPSPWLSTAALFDAGTPDHTLAAVQRLGEADMSTDWGLRSISSKSRYYQPLNYNYGAVWPFLTGFAATAQFYCQLNQQGYNNLLANCRHTFVHNLGAVNELFSGRHYLWPEEAVSQQGFSSLGIVLPALRGLFGVEGEAAASQVTMAPRFPADWSAAELTGFAIGASRWSLHYRREPGRITARIGSQNAADYWVHFAPSLGPGALVDSVRVDGQRAAVTVESFSQAVRPLVRLRPAGTAATVEIFYRAGLELLPTAPPRRLGDADSGLKLIGMQAAGSRIEVTVEGRSGEHYVLKLAESARVRGVVGASLANDAITVAIPESSSGDYQRCRFEVELAP